MTDKYPFPPDFKTIYEKADLLACRNPNMLKKLRAFYFFLYLSGTRISEALDLQYNNIQFNTIKDIPLCFATIYTRKNRVKRVRTIPISYVSEYEKKMFSEFAEVYNHSINYVFNDLIVKNERDRQGYEKNVREIHHVKKDGTETIREFKDPYASTKKNLERSFGKIIFETPILNAKERTINVQKYRLHPHLLRHFRASHLYSIYRVKREDMIEIFGWSDDRQLQIYTVMYPKELANSYVDSILQNIKTESAIK